MLDPLPLPNVLRRFCVRLGLLTCTEILSNISDSFVYEQIEVVQLQDKGFVCPAEGEKGILSVSFPSVTFSQVHSPAQIAPIEDITSKTFSSFDTSRQNDRKVAKKDTNVAAFVLL
ncbi:hypothetical protein TNCV_4002571 [Trichonephila clavipes]|uniref:Uncharacterized protein n=1 Tax=Trichonephila clavipes TaxID=2585209 RepID=A0A8X6V415_TRICX|nr:hypothetical protein TNCV_4002571 [Trichonephila clavipes]